MRARTTTLLAIAAAGLVLLTGLDAHRQSGEPAERSHPRHGPIGAAEAEQGPCAIDHARFGGQRAQLVKVLRSGAPSYVVLEVGRRDPSMRTRRAQWLRAAYGQAEHVWLGEFTSADAALTRAAKLCPPEVRCLPGTPDCGRLAPLPTPAQVFFGR
jgi:hypothetical protein